MKKLFTILLVAAFCLSVNAQAVKRSPSAIKMPSKSHLLAAPMKASVGENWWGYYMGQTDRYSCGVSAEVTYDAASFYPGDNAILKGNKIKKVRIWLRALSYLGDEVKVWISPQLPNNVDDAPVCVTVNKSNLSGGDNGENYGLVNEIELPEAYSFPATGCYVGYTFSVTNSGSTKDAAAYPVVTTREDEELPNSLFLRAPSSLPNWQNYSQNDLGNLAIQVLVEGEFSDYTAQPIALGEVRAPLNGDITKSVSFTNCGLEAITSISYVVTVDGQELEERTSAVSPSVNFGEKGTFDALFPGNDAVGEQSYKLKITKVNGMENSVDNATIEGTLTTLLKIVPRGVVVEEFTGTGCGWCPRGWVGMEKLRNTFGDSFVGIAIHRYNQSDPMYPVAYPNITFGGAPSCKINRGATIDPYYGTNNDICKDFRAALNEAPKVAVDLTGVYTPDASSVNVTANVEALIDGGPYKIEFCLIADELEGASNAWKQSNYYASYSAQQVPEDLAIFASGGIYGQSSVLIPFNDAVISSSYTGNTNRAGALGSMTTGQKKESTFTLTMPTKQPLASTIIYDKVAAVVVIVNPNGTIENAAKYYLQDPSGIADAANSANITEVARYSADGQRLLQPQSGLNIVKMSDGTVMKVMVK